MAEANWPYERVETLGIAAEPSWECPDDICTCSAVTHQDREGWEFSVMLCEPDGERMRNARCRVVAGHSDP